MSVIVSISSFIIPGIMLFIVLYGIIKKQNVYDDFVTGATGGLKTVIKVMPTLIGLNLWKCWENCLERLPIP